MFYKVVYKDRIIDVLDRLVFLKYQEKHDRMIICNESEAQAILSSNGEYMWHEESLSKIPVPGYDTVQIEEIDIYEYKQLKVSLSSNSPDEYGIIDRFVKLVFIDKEVDQLAKSLMRLYERQEIDASEVIETCDTFGITEIKTIVEESKEDE